jgi:hypothetical protein
MGPSRDDTFLYSFALVHTFGFLGQERRIE